MTKIHLLEEEIEEFKIEAEELLDGAESSLLDIDKGGEVSKNYDSIFRAFHSVKGAAGMLNWGTLQHHMRLLENHFQQCKESDTLSKTRVTYFLDGIDASRKILNMEEIQFTYDLPKDVEKTAINGAKSFSQPMAVKSAPSKGPMSVDLKKVRVPIFVLDDEADIVEILTEILSDSGFEVFGFTDASEALAAVTVKKPQAFFSDMNMPTLTGLEVVHALHKIDPDIPVVFVSAHLSKEILIESLSYGVYGAIEKPFNVEQILAIAKSATRRHQLGLLLSRSVNFVMYQFSALDEYLVEKGLHEIRDMMVKEMQVLLDVRRELREVREVRVHRKVRKAS